MLCSNLNIQSLIIELDARMIVDALLNPSYVNNIISPVFDNCRQLLTRFQQVQIRHSYRHANHCADVMARMGSK